MLMLFPFIILYFIIESSFIFLRLWNWRARESQSQRERERDKVEGKPATELQQVSVHISSFSAQVSLVVVYRLLGCKYRWWNFSIFLCLRLRPARSIEIAPRRNLEWEWRVYNNWTTVRKINTTKHCNLNLRRRRILCRIFSSCWSHHWPSLFKQVNLFIVLRGMICWSGRRIWFVLFCLVKLKFSRIDFNSL